MKKSARDREITKKSKKFNYIPYSKPIRSPSPKDLNSRIMNSLNSVKSSFKAKSAANKSRNSSKNSRMSEKNSNKKKKGKRKTLLFQRKMSTTNNKITPKSYLGNLRKLSTVGTPNPPKSILGKDGISGRLFFKRKISTVKDNIMKTEKNEIIKEKNTKSKREKINKKSSFSSKFDKNSGILNDLPFQLNKGNKKKLI